MALISNPTAGGQTTVSSADSKKKFDKAAYEKEYKAKKQAAKQAAFENALKLRDELTKLAVIDKLSDACRAFVLDACKPPAVSVGGIAQTSLFNLMFGPTPKVGDTITLEKAITSTLKGKSTINVKIKKWAEQGTVVEFTQNANELKSTYTIKALPAAK